jgi:hypothetical protein
MKKYNNIFSAISTIGIIAWFSSDYFGGMTIYLLMYWWIILPIIFVYLICLIATIISIISCGFKNKIVAFYIHLIGIVTLSAFSTYKSELFKSEIVLNAILIDDLSSINIVLRENNHFETTTNGMLGHTNRVSGEYHLADDTIVFHSSPYDNDFLPQKIIIDKTDSALYFKKLKNGNFDRAKSFANYFEIRKINF